VWILLSARSRQRRALTVAPAAPSLRRYSDALPLGLDDMSDSRRRPGRAGATTVLHRFSFFRSPRANTRSNVDAEKRAMMLTRTLAAALTSPSWISASVS